MNKALAILLVLAMFGCSGASKKEPNVVDVNSIDESPMSIPKPFVDFLDVYLGKRPYRYFDFRAYRNEYGGVSIVVRPVPEDPNESMPERVYDVYPRNINNETIICVQQEVGSDQ